MATDDEVVVERAGIIGRAAGWRVTCFRWGSRSRSWSRWRVSLRRGVGALPTAAAFIAHPIAVHIAATAIIGAVATALHVRSTKLRPESARARALDSIAAPLVFVAMFEAIFLVINLLFARLFPD